MAAAPPRKAVAAAYPEAFERFWQAYPRGGRVAKAKAAAAWKRAVQRADAETIIAAAAEYACCGKVATGFVRHATTWLNGAAWEDDRASWGDQQEAQKHQSVDEYERERQKRFAATRKLIYGDSRGQA